MLKVYEETHTTLKKVHFALYLKGLSQGSGSFVLQAIPPSDKHSESEWSAQG